MLNDNTTFKDLSIFSTPESMGIISLLDRTVTSIGKEHLYRYVKHPPETFEQLQQMQDAIRFWTENSELWPKVITNGTIVMIEKFFEAADHVSTPPSDFSYFLGEGFQKLFNKSEYFFTRFSISHISDFIRGCKELSDLSDSHEVPELLANELNAIKKELEHRLTNDLLTISKDAPHREQAKLSYYTRREMKNPIYRLLQHYARLDAWCSLAKATKEHNWTFPALQKAKPVCFKAKGLVHPLLKQPRGYDINFDEHQNFLILTGANMSGKTTFMRAIGVAVLLSHLGTGVPAKELSVSFFKGVITNMHVEDDLLKGESYFLAEVKRMKMTAQKLQKQEPHLVLMDELFKGTNVHDAYECTKAVIEGLLNRPDHLMVLSTHLYEVARHFEARKDILFNYFVTNMADDKSYNFEYELRNGISNDRIGYRILKKEGVLDLLKGNTE